MRSGLMWLLLFSLPSGCQEPIAPETQIAAHTETISPTSLDKITKTDAAWRKQLTPAQYNVLREKGTERAYTGAYWDNHEKGVYACAGCGLELFSSAHKFDSGTGWPSYWQPIEKKRVIEHEDLTYNMRRVETVCARCGGHLGHVFDDGPRPTGLRYCINSVSLVFKKIPTAKSKP